MVLMHVQAQQGGPACGWQGRKHNLPPATASSCRAATARPGRFKRERTSYAQAQLAGKAARKSTCRILGAAPLMDKALNAAPA